jgi:uncharacterized membrane protein YgaE (UPF0421/DUF939 family)
VNDTLTRGERLRALLSSRVRSGAERWRASWFTLLRAALAAGLAYGLSHLIWGHETPFFAAIAAFVIIGVNSTEKKLRKVGEMSCGVMIGVLLGEVARATIGSGTWQILVVVFLAGSFARLVDQGIMFAFQCSIQSLLVMLMPVSPMTSPQGRILDALTGVACAIIVYLLLSGDARTAQRRAADELFDALAESLTHLALSARSGDVSVADAALKEARANSQKLVDAWTLANNAADELSTYSPTNLHHADDVRRLQHLLVGSDRAFRDLRVMARRQVEYLQAVPVAHTNLAEALLACHEAVVEVRAAVDSDSDFTTVRRKLRAFTAYLTPEVLLRNDKNVTLGRTGHFEGITMVIQLRALAVDLLQATGLTGTEAERFLPSLVIASDGDTIGPRPLTQEMKALEPPATTEAIELLIADRSDPGRHRP